VSDAVQDLHNLVFRYAELVDAGDFTGVGRLFMFGTYRSMTPDGVRAAAGLEDVRDMLERAVRRFGDGTPQTRHVTTNLQVEVGDDGTTARCRSYFTVLQVVDGHLQPVIAGRYQDVFQCDQGGSWYFKDRLVLSDLIGDLSHHLAFDPF
jgi:3-phenylpropionate/cinnamic acid dioxygenase small subunit